MISQTCDLCCFTFFHRYKCKKSQLSDFKDFFSLNYKIMSEENSVKISEGSTNCLC